MTKTEISGMTESVLACLMEEVPLAEIWDKSEVQIGLEQSVDVVNRANPKNVAAFTLATAPSTWRQCVEWGAIAHCLEHNSLALKDSDPQLSKRCASMSKFYEKEFRHAATLLMQVRPQSAGMRGPRR